MNWHAVVSERILIVLFWANACLSTIELIILPAFSKLGLSLMVVNFLLFSALTAAHFHFHTKVSSDKFSFQQHSSNLFYLSAAATISIVLCSILMRQFPSLSSFPMTVWSLLTIVISLRWTSYLWKAQCLLVMKRMLHFTRSQKLSFESILLADILTTFARPISSLFGSSKFIRAAIFSVPFLIRIKQCLLDSRERRVSLWNTFKYIGLLASCAVLQEQAQLPLFCLTIPLVAIAFASWWDIVMDWNDYSILPMLLNTTIKLLPMLSIFMNESDRLLFAFSALEVYRRSTWTVLRIRNHHRQQETLLV